MNNAIFVSLPKRKIFIVTLKRVITLLNDGRENANLGRKQYAKGNGTQEAQGKFLADFPFSFLLWTPVPLHCPTTIRIFLL